MKQRCLAAVVALLLFGPSLIAYSSDAQKEGSRGARRPVSMSEPTMMVTLGVAFLGLAQLQRKRTVGVC